MNVPKTAAAGTFFMPSILPGSEDCADFVYYDEDCDQFLIQSMYAAQIRAVFRTVSDAENAEEMFWERIEMRCPQYRVGAKNPIFANIVRRWEEGTVETPKTLNAWANEALKPM